MAHSLGSVMIYDILSSQGPPLPVTPPQSPAAAEAPPAAPEDEEAEELAKCAARCVPGMGEGGTPVLHA